MNEIDDSDFFPFSTLVIQSVSYAIRFLWCTVEINPITLRCLESNPGIEYQVMIMVKESAKASDILKNMKTNIVSKHCLLE